MSINKIQTTDTAIRKNSDVPIVQNTKNSEKSIGEYLNESTAADNVVQGKGAAVSADERYSSSNIPGFMMKKVSVTLKNNTSFSFNLHIAKNVDAEKLDQITELLTRVVSNLPEACLKDFSEECTNILITETIPNNKRASALAIGPLNQIFLSAHYLSMMSDSKCAETLVHEIGHLVDQTNCSFTRRATKYYKKDFEKLKQNLTEELRFDTQSHTLSSIGEFFADYYLTKRLKVSDDNRSKIVFEKLNQYSEDVKNLSDIELRDKYGDNTEQIINISDVWQDMKNDFEFFLKNIDSGVVERMDENANPMSFEQIQERNKRVLAKRKQNIK